MAAGIPKEKAVELLELYAEMLISEHGISELDYWRAVKGLEKEFTINSISALGVLHALAGKTDKMIATFEDALEVCDSSDLAQNYCFVLRNTYDFKRLRDVSFRLADRFCTKLLTDQAASSAYRFGEREKLVHYFEMHIKLLSEDEGRDMAEKHKNELLSELDDAFDSSKCTKLQFDKLVNIIWDLIAESQARPGFVELSKNSNCCYVIDIQNKSPKEIASMNFSLAEAVCSEPELDDCNLFARFSAPRTLHTGISYERVQY